MSEKLLIVEDDKKLNDGIRLALKNDAYFFYQCRTLQEAREILKKEDITLVLLDVNLPDGNGIDFVREIRKNSQVFKDGEPIELSKTEQKLLRVLCENRGKVLKREYLIDEVWQGDTEFVDAHALTVAVKRLRDKLEDDTQKPEYVKTVYGIGYTWAVNG